MTMKADDTDVTTALAQLDCALESPRVLAQRAIAEHRNSAEPKPWINAHDVHGAPTLDIDSVVSRSEPQHAPRYRVERRRRLLFWR